MEIPQWILGALGGGFITALALAFRFGGVFAKTETALTSLNALIKDIQTKHEKHEEKNETQISALWKIVDMHGKQIAVLENENKNMRKDIADLQK